jgi:hypothetical protein
MTDIDDLKKIWKMQSSEVPKLSVKSDAVTIKSKAGKLNRAVFWRDIRESSVAILLCALFTFKGASGASLLHAAGSFVSAAGCLFVACFLYFRRVKASEKSYDENMHRYFVNALAQVNHQVWLLRNVHYWYLLPLVPGIVILNFINPDLSKAWVTNTGMFVLFVFIYWLNQQAVKKQLLPLKAELEEIVLAMEAGSQEQKIS